MPSSSRFCFASLTEVLASEQAVHQPQQHPSQGCTQALPQRVQGNGSWAETEALWAEQRRQGHFCPGQMPE